MPVQLQETDTAAPNGNLAACSGKSNLGSTEVNKTATSGGSAGSATNTFGVTTSARRAVYFETAAGELDSYSVPAGTWVVRLNITGISAGHNWTDTYVCRVNSAGVSQGTIGTLTGQSISLGTTGVKSMSISGGADTPAVGDRIYIVLVFSGDGTTATFKADQLIDTPMEVKTTPPIYGTFNNSRLLEIGNQPLAA